MGCCSDPKGYGRFFNERFARRIARKYRKRGLDGPSRRIADFVRERGIDGATVLEIGGGVGEIQIELLRAGAERAVNLELSPEYDGEARKLAEENGVAGRTERRLHDIAASPGEVEPADVVVLHRVVCCYPDYERLLAAAADHARQALVFSYPPRNIVARALVAGSNLYLRLRRSELRTFVHPPAAMLAVLERHGLEPAYRYEGLVWRIAGLERV
jgi:2-polyprenyl-3-methyl-5-hydroxy-6-metoxy-1,4-benzoquinol methylase